MVIRILRMELPQQIGLENRCRRLMFQVSLNKWRLYLMLNTQDGRLPPTNDRVAHERRTNRIMLDGIARRRIHRLVHTFETVIVALPGSNHRLQNFLDLPKLQIL